MASGTRPRMRPMGLAIAALWMLSGAIPPLAAESTLVTPSSQLAAAPRKPAYLLDPAAREILRRNEGKDAQAVLRDARIGKRLDRAFRSIAEVSKRHGAAFLRDFLELLKGPAGRAELVDGRFFFVPAGPLRSYEKAAFIVDLASGHLAMATLTGAPRAIYGELVIVQMECADEELKAAATNRFRDWAEEARYVMTPASYHLPIARYETACH